MHNKFRYTLILVYTICVSCKNLAETNPSYIGISSPIGSAKETDDYESYEEDVSNYDESEKDKSLKNTTKKPPLISRMFSCMRRKPKKRESSIKVNSKNERINDFFRDYKYKPTDASEPNQKPRFFKGDPGLKRIYLLTQKNEPNLLVKALNNVFITGDLGSDYAYRPLSILSKADTPEITTLTDIILDKEGNNWDPAFESVKASLRHMKPYITYDIDGKPINNEVDKKIFSNYLLKSLIKKNKNALNFFLDNVNGVEAPVWIDILETIFKNYKAFLGERHSSENLSNTIKVITTKLQTAYLTNKNEYMELLIQVLEENNPSWIEYINLLSANMFVRVDKYLIEENLITETVSRDCPMNWCTELPAQILEKWQLSDTWRECTRLLLFKLGKNAFSPSVIKCAFLSEKNDLLKELIELISANYPPVESYDHSENSVHKIVNDMIDVWMLFYNEIYYCDYQNNNSISVKNATSNIPSQTQKIRSINRQLIRALENRKKTIEPSKPITKVRKFLDEVKKQNERNNAADKHVFNDLLCYCALNYRSDMHENFKNLIKLFKNILRNDKVAIVPENFEPWEVSTCKEETLIIQALRESAYVVLSDLAYILKNKPIKGSPIDCIKDLGLEDYSN